MSSEDQAAAQEKENGIFFAIPNKAMQEMIDANAKESAL